MRGYLTIGIKTNAKPTYYLAQRIIWKIMTGEEPTEQIDHRNGNRLDNRWSNLRAASNGQNIHNSKLRRDNTSGVKGVCWDIEAKKWSAQLAIGKRQRRIGRFSTIEAATKAINKARLELHGAFARLS
jgi:hypothetical protein